MLKKRKNDKDDRQPSFSPVSSETAAASPPPVSAVSSQEKTVIGQHISVEGIVRGKENLVIEGSMKGSIELEKHQVTVGPNGKVEAEIHADNVIISGRLVGNINNPTTLYARGPDEVRAEVFRALDAGVQLIAPECAIPLKTKAENLVEIPIAVADWAAEHGMG